MRSVYSAYKFLRYGGPLAAMAEGRVSSPVHVRIKPTNLCNHDCWYCAYKVKNLQLGEAMAERDQIPPEKMAEIVDDLIAMDVKAVTFSGGGEPLLYKALPETIEELSSAGVRVSSLTNGSNLKGKVAEALAKHATWVRVSLDSWDDASYSKARGVSNGAFSSLLENMRNFTASRTRCVLGVSLIVDENNCTHIYDVCALVRDVGVGHVKLSPVVVSNDGRTNQVYHDKIRQTVRTQIDFARTLERTDFQIVDHYHDADGGFDKRYSFCPFLMYLTVIGADQNVYSCQDKAYTSSGRLGSIKSVSFREFWFSEANRKRLYGLDPSKECRHHCVTHAKNLVLTDLLGLDPQHGAFV